MKKKMRGGKAGGGQPHLLPKALGLGRHVEEGKGVDRPRVRVMVGGSYTGRKKGGGRGKIDCTRPRQKRTPFGGSAPSVPASLPQKKKRKGRTANHTDVVVCVGRKKPARMGGKKGIIGRNESGLSTSTHGQKARGEDAEALTKVTRSWEREQT